MIYHILRLQAHHASFLDGKCWVKVGQAKGFFFLLDIKITQIQTQIEKIKLWQANFANSHASASCKAII